MKIKNLFLLIVLISLLFPLFPQAAGLVPCGNEGEPACTFCDFFKLIDNVLDFIFRTAIVAASLLIAVGGGMFLLASENPQQAEAGKALIRSVFIGLLIIFSAFLLLGIFFNVIGLASWTEAIYKNWWTKGFFEISC